MFCVCCSPDAFFLCICFNMKTTAQRQPIIVYVYCQYCRHAQTHTQDHLSVSSVATWLTLVHSLYCCIPSLTFIHTHSTHTHSLAASALNVNILCDNSTLLLVGWLLLLLCCIVSLMYTARLVRVSRLPSSSFSSSSRPSLHNVECGRSNKRI